MNSLDLTFGGLLAPISVATFFDDALGARPLHVTGPSDKFSDAFSWTEFNRLLEMSGLWSERSMKLVLDGRNIDASEYSYPGMTRDGDHALLPDKKLVDDYLARGATLILDLVETLSPGIRAMTRALSAGMGSAIVCNAYCSWRAHQGFMAHYDTTDVFALHFEAARFGEFMKASRSSRPIFPGTDPSTLRRMSTRARAAAC